MNSEFEIEQKIKSYKKKISYLENEIKQLNKKLINSEDTISLLKQLHNQFNLYLENSFQSAKRAFSGIDRESGLEDHYMQQLNALLGSSNTNQAFNDIESNKYHQTNNIIKYEEKIRYNKKQINYYNDQIKLLRQQLQNLYKG